MPPSRDAPPLGTKAPPGARSDLFGLSGAIAARGSTLRCAISAIATYRLAGMARFAEWTRFVNFALKKWFLRLVKGACVTFRVTGSQSRKKKPERGDLSSIQRRQTSWVKRQFFLIFIFIAKKIKLKIQRPMRARL